ncbi:MAG: SLC13 family permease, partial [Planctomycetaceae bacterium]
MSTDAEVFQPLSPLEQVFERWRTRVGLVLAPVLFLALWCAPWSPPAAEAPGTTLVELLPAVVQPGMRPGGPGLTAPAHRLAAILATVVWLWVTEALPMPVTALLGASACVLLGVADAKTVFAPFADPLMFLFIGSFFLSRAIFLHGLDRRLAYGVIGSRWVGGNPTRILLAFGLVTAGLSAWISNTATTAMMLAIGVSILRFLYDPATGGGQLDRRYATGLALMTSFAASIGGLATPIGTPPNVIGLGFIRQELGIEVSFLKWMLLGVPVVTVLFTLLFLYLNWACPAGRDEVAGGRELLRQRRQELGPLSAGERSTLIAFLVTVALWLLPGVAALVWGESQAWSKGIRQALPGGVAALVGSGLLFLLPAGSGQRALSWPQAAQIDWGVVLLYGGGFALGELSNKTGLATAVGQAMAAWLPSHGEFALLAGATLVAALVSEATSNTASATIVVLLA